MKYFIHNLIHHSSGFSKSFNISHLNFLKIQKYFFQTSINQKKIKNDKKNNNLNISFDSISEFYSQVFDINKSEVSTFLPTNLLWQILTHKSYQHGKFPYNEKLVFQGKQVLKFHLALNTISIFPIYKNKNILTLKKIKQFINPETMGKLALKYNIDQVLLWEPAYDDLQKSGLLKVASESFFAIIGAIFLYKGGAAAQNFIEKKILSQKTLNDV
ncbi:hypothetical protein PCANB_002036 [Pneumocystis canis]|nr:hypothetical protein PCK1_001914 [Pneumocystis canis]KAG5439462.1 hypothetical protein PCANB_002036 [Pneumocystis canis]